MESMKKAVCIISGILFTGALAAGCRTTETAGNENRKPSLEVSFSGSPESATLSYLATVIGSGCGGDETFGERKSLIVFYNEGDCSTCERIRPVVEQWIRETGCTVYSYSSDTAEGTPAEKRKMLEKLGGGDGSALTAGRLVAFVEGRRVDSVSGTYDIATADKITKFVSRWYTVPHKSSLTVEKLAELDGLSALRRAVAYDGKFILYMERESCPDCRLLSDPARSDVITKLCNSYTGKLYRIRTERTVLELERPVVVDGKKYESAFDYFDAAGVSTLLWPDGDETEKKKAELLEMLTIQGLIPACSGDDAAFLKGILAYAQSREDKFSRYDRFVPSFAASGYTESESRGNQDARAVLRQGYALQGTDETASDDRLSHRLLYPAYFGCDNTKIDTDQYYKLLTGWILSWK